MTESTSPTVMQALPATIGQLTLGNDFLEARTEREIAVRKAMGSTRKTIERPLGGFAQYPSG